MMSFIRNLYFYVLGFKLFNCCIVMLVLFLCFLVLAFFIVMLWECFVMLEFVFRCFMSFNVMNDIF